MAHFISPTHTADQMVDADVYKKIDVFEDQTRGWLLDHIAFIASDSNPQYEHSGFVVLALCCIYLEMIAACREGVSSRGRSEEFFVKGLKSMFSAPKESVMDMAAKRLYTQVRCGLLHEGATKGGIGITRDAPDHVVIEDVMRVSTDEAETRVTGVIIHPFRFAEAVGTHFDRYVTELRAEGSESLRKNFERWFDEVRSKAE